MDAPFSKEFNDVYFSKDGAIAETEYVFLKGNRLEERFQSSTNWGKHFFTIAETGFGTGLNFLLTANLWNQKKTTNTWLHFISIEAYPLTPDEIRKYLTGIFSENSILLNLLDDFLSEYNLPSVGFYRFHFPKYRISLTLLFGDIAETLPELHADVDAWYLDGFAPSKNPAMWSKSVFSEIARLSHKGTTLTTYTSASVVRKGLQETGFTITKQKGFGRKREMSLGIFDEIQFSDDDAYKKYRKKYFHNPIFRFQPIPKIPESFHIAGAGIASASVAFALNLRGLSAKVIDPNGVANEASGNPAGIFYPYLTKYRTGHSKFSLQAFYYTNQYLSKPDFEKVTLSEGIEFQLGDAEKIDRYETSIQSHKLNKATVTKSDSSLFFPYGGSLSPKEFVHALLGKTEIIHDNIENYLKFNSIDKDSCIYCIAYKTTMLPNLQNLPLRKVRGQLILLDKTNTNTIQAIPEINSITHPITSDSYIANTRGNQIVAGSTYDEFKTDRDWSESDEIKIFQDFRKLLNIPERTEIRELLQSRKNIIELDLKEKKEKTIQKLLKTNSKDSIDHSLYRISHRCQSKDRLPVIGKIENHWIYTGLGSRGLVYSMLGGEVLVSLILGEPLPIPRSVYKAISSERFSNTQSNPDSQ